VTTLPVRSVAGNTFRERYVGRLAVMSDVPKTQVFALACHMNRDGEMIPVSAIEKPPSAELRLDQVDYDSLPGDEVLDAILDRYAIATRDEDDDFLSLDRLRRLPDQLDCYCMYASVLTLNSAEAI
jgi:NH3-dependent NAD+ synthetase